MRVLAVLVAVATLWVTPALAQTASETDPARTAHLELADRYLELTQGGELMKQMREQIEEGYADVELPADQRQWITQNLSDMLEEVLNLTLTEMRDDVADSFTVQELEASIAFYSSPTGRSVVRKQVDMNAAFQEVMAPLMVPRMGSIMEKFCQRFDCAAIGASAAKDPE